MPSEEALDRSKILDLGSQNSILYTVLQHDMWQIFFLQKLLHPTRFNIGTELSPNLFETKFCENSNDAMV